VSKSNLSHSAWQKYVTCPKMYDYHYNQRLRPVGTSSALLFGSAIDKALNALLLGTGECVAVFQNEFKWESMSNVSFDEKDLQVELFTDAQWAEIESKDVKFKTWACLRIKGRILLEAYKSEIYPKITEVHSVQKELDGRPGVLDAVVTIDGYGPLLVDHKTSGQPYKSDAIESSTQLALYSHTEKIDTVAFIVLNKTIRFNKTCSKCGYDGSFTSHKTCPSDSPTSGRCHGVFNKSVDTSKVIQLIVGKSPILTKQMIVDSMEQVEKAIKAKIYPRNLTACGRMYGKPCPYINKCWGNKDDGLETIEETKEKK
jgi:PD-(D/E)XK nuclease superfamily